LLSLFLKFNPSIFWDVMPCSWHML